MIHSHEEFWRWACLIMAVIVFAYIVFAPIFDADDDQYRDEEKATDYAPFVTCPWCVTNTCIATDFESGDQAIPEYQCQSCGRSFYSADEVNRR